MQIYDKKQNFPKNITQQKLYQQMSEKNIYIHKKIELQTIDINIGEQIL